MAKKALTLLNRELSWLEFNQRVLDEAFDRSVPLLERLNFLSITASNLDEFFMVRVGGLEQLVRQRSRSRDGSGRTPTEQLDAVRLRVQTMVAAQYRCFLEELEPALVEEYIRRVVPAELTPRQAEYVDRFVCEYLLPVVTPMRVSTGERFPLLVNLGLNVVVRLGPEKGSRRMRYALVPLGGKIPRFVELPCDEGTAYMLMEDVVRVAHGRLFPGQDVRECAAFRITRNADMSVREDMAGDLMQAMEDVLAWRRESGCVRLEIEQDASGALLGYIRRALGVKPASVFLARGPVDLSAFRQLPGADGRDSLRYPPWPTQPSVLVDPRKPIFDVLRNSNILLSHPYESFDPVVRLVEEAARDADVLAIKQILYRTSSDSPIVAALSAAARAGKAVTVIVELKARFDEARNIVWARKLEHDGVQVIYGIKGLKTHAKVCIVVRREPEGLVRYVHFGTGNYHDKTARLYSDVGYMTRDADLGADASAFFNAVSGYSEPRPYLKLSAAPMGLKERVLELIRSESARVRRGQRGLIMAKMNALVDVDIITALQEAARAGVEVRLNVRGICCLCPEPGKKRKPPSVRVVSIVDRFLEHARIFYFHHGGEERVFISSADWMPRNLERRIELLVPIDDPEARARLIEQLQTYFADTAKARVLMPDGHYERVVPRADEPPVRSQEVLYRRCSEEVRRFRQARRTSFEPHRPPAGE